MELLSLEVLENVFKFLTIKSRIRCGLVSKAWYNAFQSQAYWKQCSFELKPNYDRKNVKLVADCQSMLVSTSENTLCATSIEINREKLEDAFEYLAKRIALNVKYVCIKGHVFPETSTTLQTSVSCFPNVNEFVFVDCKFKNQSMPLYVLSALPSIKRLTVKNNPLNRSVDDFGAECFAVGQLSLAHLHLDSVLLNPGAFSTLCRGAGGMLEKLCLSNLHPNVINELFECFLSIPNLKSLSLHDLWCSEDICDEKFTLIANGLQKLECLSVPNCCVTSNGVSRLMVLKELRHLNLILCSHIDDTIYNVLENRSTDGASNLSVYVYETKVRSRNGGSIEGEEHESWKIVRRLATTENIFYGFESRDYQVHNFHLDDDYFSLGGFVNHTSA